MGWLGNDVTTSTHGLNPGSANRGYATQERRGMHSHAERGNDVTICFRRDSLNLMAVTRSVGTM
ncbi:hypothetical protein CCP3SC1_240002 [Gammaproteobacteria bacterium]